MGRGGGTSPCASSRPPTSLFAGAGPGPPLHRNSIPNTQLLQLGQGLPPAPRGLSASMPVPTPSRTFPLPPHTETPAAPSPGNTREERGHPRRPASPPPPPPQQPHARPGQPCPGMRRGRARGRAGCPQHRAGSGARDRPPPPLDGAGSPRARCGAPGTRTEPLHVPGPATENLPVRSSPNVGTELPEPPARSTPATGTEPSEPPARSIPRTPAPSPTGSTGKRGEGAGRDERRHHRVNITKSHLLTKSDLPSQSSSTRPPGAPHPPAARGSRRSSGPPRHGEGHTTVLLPTVGPGRWSWRKGHGVGRGLARTELRCSHPRPRTH